MPQLLRGITAGLLMLGKGRAVELMDAIGKQVRMLIEPGAPPPEPIRLERVADAIVSIEYYMETLQNGRTDPWYMLDNAETCLKTLADDDALARVPNLNLTSSEAAKTLKLDPAETIAMERTKRAHAATNPLIVVPEPEAVDPQFVELFIEEAKEEIASVQKTFPLWDQNPMDLEALSSMRRSFHTLKGSGRMVGARAIAEFAWSIENLLNRIIDKTLSRTPGMMALLRSSVAALPQLVEQLETGRPINTPTEALMTRAFAYADGRDPEQAKVNIAPEDRAGSDAEQRNDELGRRHGGAKAVHGRHAARHLRQGNLQSFDGNPRVPAQTQRSAGAARSTRIGISGHPYVERQFQNGGGAPWHSHYRTAEPCHAQSLRQRPGSVGRGLGDTRAVGARHRKRALPHQ